MVGRRGWKLEIRKLKTGIREAKKHSGNINIPTHAPHEWGTRPPALGATTTSSAAGWWITRRIGRGAVGRFTRREKTAWSRSIPSGDEKHKNRKEKSPHVKPTHSLRSVQAVWATRPEMSQPVKDAPPAWSSAQPSLLGARSRRRHLISPPGRPTVPLPGV